jgi:hypothetical protein
MSEIGDPFNSEHTRRVFNFAKQIEDVRDRWHATAMNDDNAAEAVHIACAAVVAERIDRLIVAVADRDGPGPTYPAGSAKGSPSARLDNLDEVIGAINPWDAKLTPIMQRLDDLEKDVRELTVLVATNRGK